MKMWIRTDENLINLDRVDIVTVEKHQSRVSVVASLPSGKVILRNVQTSEEADKLYDVILLAINSETRLLDLRAN